MSAKKTEDNVTENPPVQSNEGGDKNVDPEQSTDSPIVSGKSTAELANEVLGGRWGDFNVVRANLDKAGVNSSEVLSLVNDRLAHGAPAAYRPNISQVLDSAQRGEWGTRNHALRIRNAGYSEADALHVESQLNQGN